jgi:hypothetical protein
MPKQNPGPAAFLDDTMGKLFRTPKPRRKTDPDYSKFWRLCKKHGLTYTIDPFDGYVDIAAPEGNHQTIDGKSVEIRFTVGAGYWADRLMRLVAILDTGVDPANGEVAWPARRYLTGQED